MCCCHGCPSLPKKTGPALYGRVDSLTIQKHDDFTSDRWHHPLSSSQHTHDSRLTYEGHSRQQHLRQRQQLLMWQSSEGRRQPKLADSVSVRFPPLCRQV